MKKISSRIVVIVGLIILFVVLYTAVGSAFDKSEIKFGYWVNMDNEYENRSFVILGTDNDETRTDLILLCLYKEKENSLNVIQIPRDTRVETKRNDKKINSAYGTKRGVLAVKEDIESITGIYPDNYFVINFDGFKALVDAIGGVDYNIPMRMYYTDPAQNLKIDLKKGYQNLNGEKAEMFIRFRQNNDKSGYADGDIGRLKAQKDFYYAAINKLFSLESITNMGQVISTVGENIKTDFTISDLMNNIGNIKKLNENSVNIVMLPGESKYMEENGVNISYYVCDKQKTLELKESIIN